MTPTILFVHGAGDQKPKKELKKDLDDALFPGDPKPTTAIAYYSDICWPHEEGGLEAIGAAPTSKVADAIESMSTAGASPAASARQVLESIQPAAGAGADGGLEALPPAGGAGKGASADATRPLDAGALELLNVFLQGADQAANAAGPVAVGPDEEGLEAIHIGLPDELFKLAAGKAGVDVVRYLYQAQWTVPMRKRVRDAVADAPDPLIVVAHSLGTIITYDVLSADEFKARDIRLLVTAGSPLGISNVMTRLRDGQGPGTIPAEIESWSNFCDRLDPVAILGQSLGDKFPPFDFVHDVSHVDNPAANNHDLTGYLGLSLIRETVQRALHLVTA